MVEKDLLDILVCPDDLTPVRLATAAELTALNARIAAGQVKNRGGQAVTTAVKEGLVRADGKYLYVVDDDIPVMLIDEAAPARLAPPARCGPLQLRGDLRGQLGGDGGVQPSGGPADPQPSPTLRLRNDVEVDVEHRLVGRRRRCSAGRCRRSRRSPP